MAGPRKQPTLPFSLGKGLLMDQTARGSKRRWRNGNNVRWHDDLPEKMGGFVENVLTDENDAPQLYKGRARSYLEWHSLDGRNWKAIGTQCKLYLIHRNRLYDITPLRATHTIINGFATEQGSNIVTVVDPAHDAQTGDHVHFSGGSSVGGLTIEGEYTIKDVIDLDTYLIEVSEDAASTDSGGGTVTAAYEISCGLETDGTLSGYGTGPYGEGPYGTAREGSTFLGDARIWSLEHWGEDLLASPNGETLYVWECRWGPHSRAVAVPGAPANIEHMLIGPDDRHVIAFGTNTATGNQHQDKMFIRWCAGDNYEEWLATAENDAGSKRLDTGSKIITAVRTRQGILVFTDKSLYFGSSVGGQDVYHFEQLGGEYDKPVGKRAVVDADGIILAMCENDFYVFDGTLHVLPCEISDYIFPVINRQAQSKVQATYIREFKEVRFDFPAGESLENNRVAIYNLKERCWYVSSMARETYGDKSAVLGYPVGFANGRMYLHEYGVDAGEEPLEAFLESYEAELSEGEYQMLVTKWIPDFDRLSGSVVITLFGREYPHGPLRTLEAGMVDGATEFLKVRFRARQAGIRIESNEVGGDFRMGEWRIIAGPIGAR